MVTFSAMHIQLDYFYSKYISETKVLIRHLKILVFYHDTSFIFAGYVTPIFVLPGRCCGTRTDYVIKREPYNERVTVAYAGYERR